MVRPLSLTGTLSLFLALSGLCLTYDLWRGVTTPTRCKGSFHVPADVCSERSGFQSQEESNPLVGGIDGSHLLVVYPVSTKNCRFVFDQYIHYK